MPPSKSQRQARQGLLYAPIITALFGPSKVGKTTTALYAYPTARVYGEPRAVRPAVDTVGWIPTDVQNPEDLTDFRERLKKAYPKPLRRDLSRTSLTEAEIPYAVIADDWSTIVKRTHYALAKKFSGWELMGEIGKAVTETLLFTTQLGLDLVIIGHEKDRDDGFGGMELPTKGLIKELPKHCDFVLYQVADSFRTPHPACFKCGPIGAPAHITGARYSVFPPEGPANLGEGLRAAGVELPRAPGMEWAEAWVQRMADAILKGMDPDKASRQIALKLIREENREDWEIAWVQQDGLARAEIQKYVRSRRLSSFGFSDEDFDKIDRLRAKKSSGGPSTDASESDPPRAKTKAPKVEDEPKTPAGDEPPEDPPEPSEDPPKEPEESDF